MGSRAKKTVELFYDVVSPYTWFAFEVLTRYKTKWNMDLKLKPFFLGGVMKGSDNKPPATVPNKARYLDKDVKRCAQYFQVPLNLPKNPAEVMFIKGTLTAQRFLTAVDIMNQEKTESVSREFWMRAWNRDEDITEMESLRQVGLKAGMNEAEVQKCLQKITDPEVKDRLKKYTDEALRHGAFGSPTIIAHVNNQPEMVFGSDRFPILATLLGEKWEGPLTELSKCKL
ncbi:hypothetical protein CHS0354_001769 [Potamilus streckersoni]|uniref:Glutathione S-transferase kappa n=1 Tax=Potamilus streckersoni TaxID=2493646 RepID=A0AAE0SJ09_9BIVA|nr:hypothetical protein CHS0354_001769 [Potamilus streckersoni]